MRRRLIIFALWLGLAVVAWPAETLPPAPTQYFNDYAGVVSAQTAATLNNRLEAFEKQTSNQVLVAVFPKMQSDSSIEDYTQRVAQSWRVGQKATNNGVVLFVFIQEHNAYIQVGYGLEGSLPDALAKQIIENEIFPHFKSGDYDGGLASGVTAIQQAIRGEYKGNGSTVGDQYDDTMSSSFTIGIVLFVIILSIIANRFRPAGTVYGSRVGRGVYIGGFGGWGGGGGFGGGGGGGG
ncbi:MAG TPA: TPM domain-containing protein, partial [Opitutales bacterium]|nr:TPM domain-containing protein [Opitutales bacterium]